MIKGSVQEGAHDVSSLAGIGRSVPYCTKQVWYCCRFGGKSTRLYCAPGNSSCLAATANESSSAQQPLVRIIALTSSLAWNAKKSGGYSSWDSHFLNVIWERISKDIHECGLARSGLSPRDPCEHFGDTRHMLSMSRRSSNKGGDSRHWPTLWYGTVTRFPSLSLMRNGGRCAWHACKYHVLYALPKSNELLE